MSFRSAALIALLIGVLASAGFSFAVIAYVKAQEVEEARRVDKVRTDTEIARIAEAVFRKHETQAQRSRRIQGAAKVAIAECKGDPACVRAGQQLFGLSKSMLRVVAREEVRLYCAAHNGCRGTRGATGQRGRDGVDGSSGTAGKPDPRVGELVRDVATLRRAVTDLQSRKQDSAVANGLDNRLADVERGLQSIVGRIDGLQRIVTALCHILTPTKC